MNKIKRTQITIETRELTIIKTRCREENSGYCQSCGANVIVFAHTQAASIFRVSEQFLEELFKSNAIHETEESALCGNSLVRYFK